MSTREAYGVVLVVAAVATFAFTPLVRAVAIRFGMVVAPDARRVHEKPTPQLGGIAMLIGFLLGMLVAWRLGALRDIFAGNTEPMGVVVAAVLMLIVGAIDDVREVSAPAKAAGVVLCASVLVWSGVSMIVFRFPFAGVIELSTDWSYLLSVLWVFGMTTAVNFIDGLDGLAAGIVAIASGTFFLYAMELINDGLLQTGNIAPLIAILVLGMCLGFLPFNFHPAKIFMGDGGALLLGLLMAASTMVVGGRTDVSFSGQTYFFFAPLFIPLFILGVPIVDTLFAIVRRTANRQGAATADKDHLHHRLMRLGHGQRRSVLILWAWTALLSALVLFPTYASQGEGGGKLNVLVPIGIAALVLALYTVLHPGLRSARRNDNGNGANGRVVTPEEALAALGSVDAAGTTSGNGKGGSAAQPAGAPGAPEGGSPGLDPDASAGS